MKIREIYRKLKRKQKGLEWIRFTDQDEVELVFFGFKGFAPFSMSKEEFERDSETYKLMAELEKDLRTK